MEGKNLPLWVAFISLVVVITAVAIGWRVLYGDGSLLRNVSVGHERITPNADGVDDATPIAYELSRNATVSIYFENDAGRRFYFRQEQPRGAGEYQVLFSGVVDGFRLPGETIEGEIITRLLPDGHYTWTVEATDGNGVTERAQGRLQVADATTTLPEIRGFNVGSTGTFTPNQDGIDDRVKPQFYLAKDVEEIRVFLLMPDGQEEPITVLERDVPAGQEGYHIYDYDGGVDNKATPPPDGTYPIVAEARDAEGQRIRVQDELTIQYGGVPRADIFSPPAGRTLEFSATAVPLCQTIYFTITVRNYGVTPIRTSGPPPGTVYDSNWNYNTLGWYTESGVFRVAIGYENELSNYPYRWAIGHLDDLEKIGDHYYLMPGERVVITGGIRVVDRFGVRNPQPMWAGLIHEDVEIAPLNNRVDPQPILVDLPDPDNRQPCHEREIPVRPEVGQH